MRPEGGWMRVAFQGEVGANSEEAAIRMFGGGIEPVPRTTFLSVFEAVERGEVSCGVLPVENSQTGGVDEVLDLLWARSLSVTAHLELPVHHCLIGRPSDAPLLTAHSHPQALAQCAQFLAARGLTPVAEYDTAGSAKLLAEGKLPRGASVIASRRGAELYGLTVLAENIETRQDNATRFYAVERTEKSRAGKKTVLAFAVSPSRGELRAALGALVGRQIPIVRLDSRPLKTAPWEYVLFLEVEEGLGAPWLAAAVQDLEKLSLSVKVLGSF